RRKAYEAPVGRCPAWPADPPDPRHAGRPLPPAPVRLPQRDYFPVILDQGQGAAELGLRYAHNDMCYPFHLSLGQYLLALGSGAYDLENTALLMPSAGDACRGSNFTSLIRKALVQAGYPQVKVL